MDIAIFTGEVSGDLSGAALARAFRQLEPEARLWGLGSQAMRDAGVELLADSSEWGAISISEAIVKVPSLLARIAPKVKRALRERRPDVVILLDFGAFNVRAARYCKEIGLKVLYYFPPGSWKRTGSPPAEIARIADVLAVPFPFAEERYRQVGARTVFVGHPLLERVKPALSRDEFAERLGLDLDLPIIGLLPGSRGHEVKHLMPTLVETAQEMTQFLPEAQFVVGLAPTLSPERMKSYLAGQSQLLDRIIEKWGEFAIGAEERVKRTAEALTPPSRSPVLASAGQGTPSLPNRKIWKERDSNRSHSQLPAMALACGLTYETMCYSDVLLVCSGTATLEAALFGTPMVILYRGSRLMEMEYKLRGLDKKIRFIGLPNILSDRKIVPELIQAQAVPETISREAHRMLSDLPYRQQIRRDLLEVRQMLGEPGASERTARLALDLAKGNPLPV